MDFMCTIGQNLIQLGRENRIVSSCSLPCQRNPVAFSLSVVATVTQRFVFLTVYKARFKEKNADVEL